MREFLSKNTFLMFCIKFFASITIFYTLISITFISKFITTLTVASSNLAVMIMQLFDGSINSYKNYIISDGHSIQVGFGCEGSEPVALLCAGILAFPVPIKKKIPGLLIGSFILLVLNQARIITLFYLTKYNPENFSLVHNDLFPLITVIFSGLVFLAWIKYLRVSK